LGLFYVTCHSRATGTGASKGEVARAFERVTTVLPTRCPRLNEFDASKWSARASGIASRLSSLRPSAGRIFPSRTKFAKKLRSRVDTVCMNGLDFLEKRQQQQKDEKHASCPVVRSGVPYSYELRDDA